MNEYNYIKHKIPMYLQLVMLGSVIVVLIRIYQVL